MIDLTMQNYTRQELIDIGISIGKNVQVHKTVQFFGSNIQLGSNVRIDCYSVITAKESIILRNHVHLGAGVHIFGSAGVEIGNFATLSSRCSIFTTSDDYTDGFLTNPTVLDKYKKINYAPVVLKNHVIVGCGSVIMPGVTLYQGASVGALSFVNKDVTEFSIVAGTPIRKIGVRNSELLLQLEKEFKQDSESK